MSDDTHYEISGLTRIDAERLKGLDGVAIDAVPVPDGAYGEPITFTMVVSMAALSTLAAYLLRKGQHEEFDEEVTTVHADGRRETRRVRWRKSATEAPESSVIKAIQGR